MNGKDTLRIHPDDNVVVALNDLCEGLSLTIDGVSLVLNHTIPAKHKFALCDISKGHKIVMYGILVGLATKGIRKGDAITTSNVAHQASEYALNEEVGFAWNPPVVKEFQSLEFSGYIRDDGRVGTANYWIVVPLVFCENRNVEFMKHAFQEELGYKKGNEYRQHLRDVIGSWRKTNDKANGAPGQSPRVLQNIDGIKFLTHHMGCGGTPSDARMLCGLLAGYITHPNVAGATVLSLGCQDAQTEILKEEIDKRDRKFRKPTLFFEQQRYGTERALLITAIEQTFKCMTQADRARRASVPLSELTIGVECGGSDGFSGLSANPAIGHAADLLVALGGKVILSEFPELCGVEKQLIQRCVNAETAARFIKIQGDYASKAEAVGAGFYLNPSAGNIKDGLITDAMKSAGAVKKGGSSPVTDVLDYPEMVTKPGLNLLCTPGSDVESTTALVGAGATLVLFSTGLGTPTGNPIAPVLKISSNSRIAEQMHDIIDVDAGRIISGTASIEDVGSEILRLCVEVASGKAQAKAVVNGQDDFIPWKRGISL